MVVHKESEEPPVELAIIKQPLYENSGYTLQTNNIFKMSREYSQDEDHLQKNIRELKKVYLKCKSVIKEIETKYGHLLEQDDPHCRTDQLSSDSDDEEECQCAFNKKIMYDDEGNEVKVDTQLENHICQKKLKSDINNHSEINNHYKIEYEELQLDLPNDLNELANILKDPDLPVLNRYKVLDKIKALRQEYANELKFNKQALIEKLKTCSDEIIGFKGTNLSSLPGYS